MFTDSEIVLSFLLSKTKFSYINFGLVPYFKDLLPKEIEASDYFGVSQYEQSIARGANWSAV